MITFEEVIVDLKCHTLRQTEEDRGPHLFLSRVPTETLALNKRSSAN